MDHLQVIPIPSRNDNYIWAYINKAEKKALIVDPGEAEPVIEFLQKHQLQLMDIFITHPHYDHIDGLDKLIETYKPIVYGAKDDNIAGMTHFVSDGDHIDIPYLQQAFEVMFIPGHTEHHLAYYAAPYLFCGDTLFSIGCGRVLQGTIEDLFGSILLLRSLPDDTLLCCAHEYTLNNITFAKHIDPDNQDLLAYEKDVQQLRADDKPSLPALLKTEKTANPFLRFDQPNIKERVAELAGIELDSEFEVFAAMRFLKDEF